MITIIEAIILGIVQGITEWFPISSSGHLVILQNLLGITEPIIFDVMLHFGSLIVLLIVFWKDLIEILKGLLKLDKYYINYVLMLGIASIPIAVIGLFFNDFIKGIFNSTKVVGVSLLITALVLFLSRYPEKKTKKLTFLNTIFMGIAQALAILPGVSRSGSTISLGLIQGIKREEAAKFSFLLAIPAILGANLLELRNISQISNLGTLFISIITVIIVGYLSLNFLLKLIKKNKFSYFGWYCLVLGLIVIFFL